jgi:hypothetical protein
MIEPLMAATTFASIVGLIGQFRAERSGSEKAKFEEFELWLENNHRQDVLAALLGNTSAIEGIKEVMQEDNDVILKRLEGLDAAFTAFATNVRGFAQIAEGLNPNAVLSVQAVSILKQFELGGSSKILESGTFGGPSYMFLDGDSGDLKFEEEQFLEDDLLTLVDLGLLRPDFNSKGGKMFRYTRVASQLLGTLNDS